MTTIRVSRNPRMLPEPVVGAAAQPPVSPTDGAGNTAVRLALIEPPAAGTTLDGAWWPRTRNLTEELPALVEELHRRRLRVTRVAYHPDAWAPTPRRLPADGRTIRLGWFRSVDRHLLNLTADGNRGRLDLLVVPPDTTASVAQQAFSAATDRASRQTPTALLEEVDAASRPVPPPRSAAARLSLEETAVWDSEGGHLLGGES